MAAGSVYEPASRTAAVCDHEKGYVLPGNREETVPLPRQREALPLRGQNNSFLRYKSPTVFGPQFTAIAAEAFWKQIF